MQIICFQGISCGSVFVKAAGRILGVKSPQKDDLTGDSFDFDGRLVNSARFTQRNCFIP